MLEESEFLIEETVTYAAPYKRLIAIIIDFIILVCFDVIIELLAEKLGFKTTFTYEIFGINIEDSYTLEFTSWLYFSLFESSRMQATIGKKILNLRVVNKEGMRISFGQATGRYFAQFLNTLTLGYGYLMIIFTKKHQGLHDKLARTYVINA